jgi:hypothetical protein
MAISGPARNEIETNAGLGSSTIHPDARLARITGIDLTPYVRVFLGQLRQKVEADPARPRLLVNERRLSSEARMCVSPPPLYGPASGKLDSVKDTRAGAEARYFELLRQSSPAKRLSICVSLSRTTRELAIAGIRQANVGRGQGGSIWRTCSNGPCRRQVDSRTPESGS